MSHNSFTLFFLTRLKCNICIKYQLFVISLFIAFLIDYDLLSHVFSQKDQGKTTHIDCFQFLALVSVRHLHIQLGFNMLISLSDLFGCAWA